MTVSWTMLTPMTAAGAVGVVRLAAETADQLDEALRTSGLVPSNRPPLRVGEVRLCNLLAIDHGLIVRWNDVTVDLFPHGGVLVQRQLQDALVARGIPEQPSSATSWQSRQPAARDELEALMLDVLARAASPRAIDLLLAAPATWHQRGTNEWKGAQRTPRDARLRRLIDPPLVVLIGAANIGKSTLINSLARRAVSIVDAQPGSTRDHVGVLLQLDGLVARVVDTPGIRSTSDPIESEAQHVALTLAMAADLLLLCGDAAHQPFQPPAVAHVHTMRVALRCDLGLPDWPRDNQVSAARSQGIDELAQAIREALVPDADFKSGSPWTFW